MTYRKFIINVILSIVALYLLGIVCVGIFALLAYILS